MPYRIKPDGTVETDTAEEMLAWLRVQSLMPPQGAIARLTENGHPVGGQQSGRPPSPPAPIEERMITFLGSLRSDNQRQFIELLYSTVAANPLRRVTDVEVREALGLESNSAVAGVFRGLAAHATNAGMRVADVFTTHSFDQQRRDDGARYAYMLTQQMRGVIAQTKQEADAH